VKTSSLLMAAANSPRLSSHLSASVDGASVSLQATPKKRKCNCKQSRCLKLYCECFASGIYCNDCNCQDCYNNKDHEQVRQEAVEATLERNPDAFRPKIQSMSPGMSIQDSLKHNKGCNCKRSFCLKRYCECFQANIYCSDNCRCTDCKNFEGSSSRLQVTQAASPSSRLQSSLETFSPRKRSKKEKKSTGAGKHSGGAVNGSGSDLAAISTFSQQLQAMDSKGSGGEAPASGQVGQVVHPGLSPMVNQMLLAPCMLAGIINEEVVKHLSNLLHMVSRETEENYLNGHEARARGKGEGGNKEAAGNGTGADAGDGRGMPNSKQSETSDTVTEEEDRNGESRSNGTGESHLEKALLCEEEPQGLFELDSPKGYNLNKQRSLGLKEGMSMMDTSDASHGTNANASPTKSHPSSSSGKTQGSSVRRQGGAAQPAADFATPSCGTKSGSLYEEQEKAILTELNNCLQVVSQMGRSKAEMYRSAFALLSNPTLPLSQALASTQAANNVGNNIPPADAQAGSDAATVEQNNNLHEQEVEPAA